MNKSSKSQGLVSFFFLLSLCVSTEAMSDIKSVLIDRESSPSKIIVLGSGLAGASFKLAGITIPSSCSTNVSDTEQHIGFCTETALAVSGSGSYNLLVNDVELFAIYMEQAIIAPPPPPLSSECPCTPGWDASDVPKYNVAWCLWGENGTQEWITTAGWIDGSGRQDILSAAFDPNKIFFDTNNVGNSEAFCALHDGNDFTVSEPVVSWEQYEDCYQKMYREICFW